MNQDFDLPDRIDGCPSFVRRSGDGINWWAPARAGNDAADFATGRAHFETALSLLHGHAAGDFYWPRPMIDLFSFLPDILAGMRSIGAIERGFLDALVCKAVVGCAPPPLPDHPTISEFDRAGEGLAELCIQIGSRELILTELISAIDKTFDCGNPRAFIWTVCLAASSGGRH
jgi:hypothetical protein